MKNFIIACLLLCLLGISGCNGKIPKSALQMSSETLANRQVQTRKFETTDYEAMLGAATAVFQDLGFSVDEADTSLGVIVGSKARDATSAGQVTGALVLAALTGVATPVDSVQVIRASMVVREIQDNTAPQESHIRPKLTIEEITRIKDKVQTAVSDGLRNSFPENISQKVALKIGADTAKTLATDLERIAKVQSNQGTSTVRVTFQRVIFDTHGNVTKQEQIKDADIYQQFFDKLSQSVFLEAQSI